MVAEDFASVSMADLVIPIGSQSNIGGLLGYGSSKRAAETRAKENAERVGRMVKAVLFVLCDFVL